MKKLFRIQEEWTEQLKSFRDDIYEIPTESPEKYPVIVHTSNEEYYGTYYLNFYFTYLDDFEEFSPIKLCGECHDTK